jgi:hypothetical protein
MNLLSWLLCPRDPVLKHVVGSTCINRTVILSRAKDPRAKY